MICFPGGLGDADNFNFLTKEHRQRIQKFVHAGGAYLGICMGAYWAGSEYFNLIKDVDAVQYIKRPGTDTRRPHAKNLTVNWQGKDLNMFFYDGCSLIGNERKFKVISRYSNNDPMAIIQNNIGIIGCHPESEKFWYNKYKYIKQHWHHGRHHMLLLDFVNRLSSNQTTVINSRKY